MDLAEETLSGRYHDLWRWLYRLSVALLLTAVAMPYVVAVLWKLDLIIDVRPWTYYGLNNVFYIIFVVLGIVLIFYFSICEKYVSAFISLISVLFLIDAEDEAVAAFSYAIMATLLSLHTIEKIFMSFKGFIKFFSSIIFLVLWFMILLAPVNGWTYTLHSGYVTTYGNVVKYKDVFVTDVMNRSDFNFLCSLVDVYDRFSDCIKKNLINYDKVCSRVGNDIIEFSIVFYRNAHVDLYPYIRIIYDGEEVYEGQFLATDPLYPSKYIPYNKVDYEYCYEE